MSLLLWSIYHLAKADDVARCASTKDLTRHIGRILRGDKSGMRRGKERGKSALNCFKLCSKLSKQRLSTKSNLKLAKLWLDRKEYARLAPVGYREP